MFIRQLHYLVTLAQEQHFAKAAELSHVSQPALSSAIRSLEAELGLVIVRRGRRFIGFTEEGERVLGWARQTLATLEHMRQDASAAQVRLTGTIRIGVIPTTMPIVGLLLGACRADHAAIRYSARSLSADTILRQLDDYELDVGFTYLDDRVQAGFAVLPLYRERYFLLSPPDSPADPALNRWDALGELPFCLLGTSMQNRQVINAAFRRAGVQPTVVLETDSLLALYSNVQHAGLYSILPHSLLSVLDTRTSISATPLLPELTREIGLITRNSPSMPPLAAAMWSAAERLDLQQSFDALLQKTDIAALQ
ncbi:Hydrogen peroxide-inducible genes activator [Paraburkholderia aspalathi]|jgi:DNA-binding transcriptional LysR family regulator|uniref:DNA-binding transcriptional regulator, LysR family n=1 Tax=Paraburkholderia aspalathi TaxID=1324617 RepID=A0A1I7E2B9_9BURK|nr:MULTISPECIES: LysR family transcriptional regulator [Paraburkholderia]MCP2089138.1 DNA-binding transcriptional LysR family regulator [Paraburkholderia sediminicola]MBK3818734.1 LysR family transcriptional regulator [Paraburkholderia aspalathi]MBK3830582.1 LysR family transcriptional regulator [Paraburkholderia aspalathi]MBK3860288.1 LysR family transcriptional regulator [Paraburkholderia aspalathi]MCX4137027.1 LysR family transcriptional regulator [Paraburkholderia aspalathi]